MSSNILKIGLYKKLQGGQEAECLLCNNHEKKLTISTKNWASSGLLSHLKAKHKGAKFYEEFVRFESDAPVKRSIEKFMNITSGCGLSCTDKRVINYIVCTLTSFCHLNNPTTRAFCRDALKDESHYRKTVLPKVYAAVKQKILVEVNEFEHLSFTTDIWSGPKDSYISLTAHGITKNWEKRSFVLSVSAFPGTKYIPL